MKPILLEQKYSYCSTQVNVPEGELKLSLLKFEDDLPDEDVNEEAGGCERELHTTILYGIKSVEGLEAIKKIIPTVSKSIPVIKVGLSKITMFENDEFDVLKIDIISPELHKLHTLFKKITEWESDFPDYKPHLTLAYLKKGTGKKYINDDRFEGQSFESDSFLFCNNDGNKTKIQLSQKNGLSEEAITRYRSYFGL